LSGVLAIGPNLFLDYNDHLIANLHVRLLVKELWKEIIIF